MPLNSATLSSAIKAKLIALPMGTGVISASVGGAAGKDGTMTTTMTPTVGPMKMDPGMAAVIADAVAEAVVIHLQTCAVVAGGKIT